MKVQLGPDWAGLEAAPALEASTAPPARLAVASPRAAPRESAVRLRRRIREVLGTEVHFNDIAAPHVSMGCTSEVLWRSGL